MIDVNYINIRWFSFYLCGFFLALTVFAQDLIQDERQLTFTGKRSGEGYYSSDGNLIVFQSESEKTNPFYQIYLLDLRTGETDLISTGTGKSTCAWIHPNQKQVLFSSTHLDESSLDLQKEEFEKRESGKVRKYSWDYDKNYDIFSKNLLPCLE